MTNQPIVELQDISKTFYLDDVHVNALNNVSLKIFSGEFLALQGVSGSGKSTLLNVIGLIENVDKGEVYFRDENISKLSDYQKTERRRLSIAYVFQNFNLLSAISAVENVEYPLYLIDGRANNRSVREQAMKMLELVGVAQFAKHKPSQLSGGQRQRVAIARALVKNPSLILADEPTANLDSKNAIQIIQLLKKLNKDLGTTVILATHDDQMAKVASRRIYLSDGQITSDLEAKHAH